MCVSFCKEWKSTINYRQIWSVTRWDATRIIQETCKKKTQPTEKLLNKQQEQKIIYVTFIEQKGTLNGKVIELTQKTICLQRLELPPVN